MKYFGTDGIREKAEWFTYERLAAICAGLVEYGESQKDHDDYSDGSFLGGYIDDLAEMGVRVVIGGDTRESSEWILQDIATILETLGAEYANVGVLPTPAINYFFDLMNFDFAIDVTASHNPYTDNGIKIFEWGEEHGQKLSAEGCAAVEEALASGIKVGAVGATLREDWHDDAVSLYGQHLREYVGEVDLSGMRIGVDCANGATSVFKGVMFEGLGAEVVVINADASYGVKINDGCGSTHLEQLTELVLSKGLDFGVAFDGDGDRCLIVDKNGEVIDGDQIIAILVTYLKLNAAAVTVMSNQGLFNWAKEHGVELTVTPVGDANVYSAMCEKGVPIGGEQSGHVILPGEPTGDGMLTALMVAKAVAELGVPINEIAKGYQKMPQVNLTLEADAEQKDRLTSDDATKAIIAQYEEKVKSMNGRILVRPSGTEKLIRITVWGDDLGAIEEMASQLKRALKKSISSLDM